MFKQRKWSIGIISKVLPILILVLILINIITVSFIGIIYISINNDEKQSGDYFRNLNSYILLIINSGGHVSPELISGYEELSAMLSGMSKRLVQGAELTPPLFSDEKERALYSAELRFHAAAVRTNLSSFIHRSYFNIGFMLISSIAASIILMIFMLFGRYAVREYGREMTSGLGYMEKILKYENTTEYNKISSNIIEVQQLQNALVNLSNDISYNRKLVEKGVHGNLDLLLSEILSSLKKRMPCDRIALAFIGESGMLTAETAVSTYNRLYLEPGFSEPLGNTSLVRLIESGEPRIINDLPAYASGRKISESTSRVLREGIKSSITVPMLFNEKCLGFFFVSSMEINAYDAEMMHYAQRVLGVLKQKIYIEFLLQEVISETSNAFVGLMEEKDNETSAHITRMSQYSYITARAYHEHIESLHPRFMREILWFSPLHDIGKVGTPDSILLKKGSLSEEEMSIMKEHVNTGSRVLEKMNARLYDKVSFPLMQTAVEIIAGHHEKFNGRGYPLGLSGEEIPLAGRIVALADVFDALTSKRPYKEAFSIEKALDIMKTDMAGSFDPRVLSAFIYGLPEIKKVYDEFKEI